MLGIKTSPVRPPSIGRTPERRRGRRRILIALSIVVVVAMFTPIPWLLPRGTDWGMAWRLDGNLAVNGEVVAPSGRWTWLTAGRPPLVVEVLLSEKGTTRDLRDAPASTQPEFNEPMAAAVGLVHAGYEIEFGLIVEAVNPINSNYPERAIVVEMNGVPLSNYAMWKMVVANSGGPVTFRTNEGQLHTAPGPGLPYERVYIIDEAPQGVRAVVGGPLASIPPFKYIRNLALGRSHGLIVALATYAHAADGDLAAGRHVAATGGVRGDGTVTRIGGLLAKASAARRAGVEIMFFPADQAGELAGFDPGVMELVPVRTLAEAIVFLEATGGRLPNEASESDAGVDQHAAVCIDCRQATDR